MNTFDSKLASRLHDMVDGETGSRPPTQMLLARGRRARHRRAAAVVSASLAVLAVGGVTATLVAQPSAPGRPGVTTAANADAPRLRLVAAVTASENISYKVKVTAADKDARGGSESTDGAFDPATATGFLNSSFSGGGPVYYERLINGIRYVGSSGSKDQWKQYPGKHDRLAYDKALDSAVGASADPNRLFEALRQAGAKITEAGAGTYRFEVALTDDATGLKNDTLVGDVTVGTDKRIAKVTYERTTQYEKRGQVSTSTVQVTVELSGYGTPVKVEQPTDVVVVK